MTSAAARTPTPTTAAFNSTCKWRPNSSAEYFFATISLQNPPTTTAVSARCRRATDRGHRRFALSVVPRATSPSSSSSSSSAPKTRKDQNQNRKDDDDDDDDDDIDTTKQQQQSQPSVSMIRLDDVNPVGLGRRSRQIFDEVWRKFSGLGQISRTTRTDDETSLLINEGGPMCEFAIPGAQNTTVLVVGATSRVGRIVVRKLMLRGYTVKALVRKADEQAVDMLPTSVEIVIGDVGDPSSLRSAVKGCNKIIYCATARSSITGDLNRVDHQGVYNLTKAFQFSYLPECSVLH